MELVFLKLWIQWSSFFWSLNPALVESWDYLQREPAAQEQILFQIIWGWHQSTVGQKSDIIGWYEVIKYFQCSLELPSWGFSDLLMHANFLKKLERVKMKNSALVLINIGNDHLAIRIKNPKKAEFLFHKIWGCISHGTGCTWAKQSLPAAPTLHLKYYGL